MKHFYLRVQALSPLAIRSDHAEGGAKTAQYIPGATLLGSLAAAHRMLREKEHPEFANFFLKEQVYFPHLYPALFNKSKSGIHSSFMPVVPFPKTAQTCKRFSGFLPMPDEDSDEKRHGIRDSLLDWSVFSLLEHSERATPSIQDLLKPLHAHKDCTYLQQVNNDQVRCGQVMDHASGYYRRGRLNMTQRMKAKTDQTRLQTRTGVNRDWGVVEEGILYNREVFDAGMFFWGELLLADDLPDNSSNRLTKDFKTFVQEANEEDCILIGTGRTRGLGSIKVEIWDEVQVKDIRSREIMLFTQRLNLFNTTLQQRAQAAGVNVPNHFYFAVTLQSPSVLCDPYLRYQTILDTKLLEKELGLRENTCKHIYQSTGMQRISGWNELWGTPRTNDYALEMGSTFLFAYIGEVNTPFFNALHALQERGIGRRRAEGFGRISISDPFHLEGEQA